MAKQFYFYDASGVRRRVKSFYFYDSTGARRAVKAGYFYDGFGERKQFFAGGLSGPTQGYYPGSNFTMKAGENSTETGFQGGSYGEVKPDAGTTTDFPLYPTTDATAHQAQMLYAKRYKATSVFDMYYYRNPFPNPAEKFFGFVILNQAGQVYDALLRSGATETVNANDVLYRWSYLVPLTVGSNYTFLAKETAANTNFTTGNLNEVYGYSGGVIFPAFGSIANAMLTTRIGWNIVAFFAHAFDEYVQISLQGPSGATDPGAGFIAGFETSVPGIQSRESSEAIYSWDAGNRVASWSWEESSAPVNGQNYTLKLG